MSITPDETFELFKKEENKNLTLEELSHLLNRPIEELCDMTLDQIATLSKSVAEQKTDRINNLLNKRNEMLKVAQTVNSEAGVTKEDLTTMFFEELKNNI